MYWHSYRHLAYNSRRRQALGPSQTRIGSSPLGNCHHSLRSYAASILNDNAKKLLLKHRLRDPATNCSYRPGQLLFINWSQQHHVSETAFPPTDFINFLSDMFTTKKYSIGTIQLFRTAVTHLHDDPASLRNSTPLNEVLNTLRTQAPPVRLHRPTADLQPTFNHLRSLNNATVSLSVLQSKLAVLLGVACFLRPSDLHRIPFSSVSLSDSGQALGFEVHAPKEKRNRRSIIKSFIVKAHCVPQLCPIATYSTYCERRPTSPLDTLFLNSKNPPLPIAVRTIQRWITRLIGFSTQESGVSIRFASSLADLIKKEDNAIILLIFVA